MSSVPPKPTTLVMRLGSEFSKNSTISRSMPSRAASADVVFPDRRATSSSPRRA